jgi:hypothetical protein
VCAGGQGVTPLTAKGLLRTFGAKGRDDHGRLSRGQSSATVNIYATPKWSQSEGTKFKDSIAVQGTAVRGFLPIPKQKPHALVGFCGVPNP